MHKLPTIALCGPGECGKDVSANYVVSITPLRLGRTTSEVIAPHIAAEDGITPTEAHARRRGERDRWAAKGDFLCTNDPAYLVRGCLEDGDIVVGIRRLAEIQTVRALGLVDLIVWIDRTVVRDSTIEFDSRMCDVILDNNGTIPELERRLRALARFAGLC
jgi:hypothetical protein